MSPAAKPNKVVLVLLAVASVMALGFVSAGASTGTCAPNDNTKCVTGTGAAISAGTSLTGAQIAVECTGAGTRSSITQIKCWVPGEDISQTRSFDGTAAASVILSDIGDIDPRMVCWEVTGLFTDIFGDIITVVDDDCTILHA